MNIFYYSTLFCMLFLCRTLTGEELITQSNGLNDFASALSFIAAKEPVPNFLAQENLKNAILDEELENVRSALKAGADSDYFYEFSTSDDDLDLFITKYSALGLALRMENRKIIKLILTTTPNLENVKMVTMGPRKVLSTSALYEALEIGNPTIIKLILSKKPNLKVVAYGEKNKKSYSALQVAIQKGDLESVRLILIKLLEDQEKNIIKYSYWAREALKEVSQSISSSELQKILAGKIPSKNNIKIEFETREKILKLIERAAQAQDIKQAITSPTKTTNKAQKYL